jgi:eukaryotic-like serine/threonine-protein kinase
MEKEWQEVKEIFCAALEYPPEERRRFLDEACRGDARLRSEIESLLDSYGAADQFLETPAVGPPAVFESEGRTLGRYEITRKIGTGGMGEVYLARDAALKRKVALKILPPLLMSGEERLARFNQEAELISALNHPNIITIYEIGAENGVCYIATEYIDGETLREKMQPRKLTVPEILEIARQTASALSAAHENGVIHRDIKPENIMIRRDELVKVLDFGLAKLIESDKKADFEAATQVKTVSGVIMGTVHYMSPEQARGRDLDERTDIWSFGVVLYEMLAGRKPFEGDSTADIIGNILHREAPDLRPHCPDAPAELARIVSKTLRPEREDRYQTIGELSDDLGRLQKRLEYAAEFEQTSAVVRRVRPQPRRPASGAHRFGARSLAARRHRL